MENLSDDVLCNILARLPGKPLQRSRCVSMHWNRLISDPCFMKLRSRRVIFLPLSRHLAVLDYNVPLIDKDNSIVGIPLPLEQKLSNDVESTIVGTLNGMVILALTDLDRLRCHLVLYNPLTCVWKRLVVMKFPRSCLGKVVCPYAFGFADDELKIVKFDCWSDSNKSIYTWDVFDLKTSSWSGMKQNIRKDFCFLFDDAGMYLNGFLYWVTSSLTDGVDKILVLDVKKMVFVRIKLPVPVKQNWLGGGTILGSKDGCLCMVSTIDDTKFDFWLLERKEEQYWSWSKAHSFALRLPDYPSQPLHPLCILRNGKILFTNKDRLLVMYDVAKDAYENFSGLVKNIDAKVSLTVSFFWNIRSIDYVETLVSPRDPLLWKQLKRI